MVDIEKLKEFLEQFSKKKLKSSEPYAQEHYHTPSQIYECGVHDGEIKLGKYILREFFNEP